MIGFLEDKKWELRRRKNIIFLGYENATPPRTHLAQYSLPFGWEINTAHLMAL